MFQVPTIDRLKHLSVTLLWTLIWTCDTLFCMEVSLQNRYWYQTHAWNTHTFLSLHTQPCVLNAYSSSDRTSNIVYKRCFDSIGWTHSKYNVLRCEHCPACACPTDQVNPNGFCSVSHNLTSSTSSITTKYIDLAVFSEPLFFSVIILTTVATFSQRLSYMIGISPFQMRSV